MEVECVCVCECESVSVWSVRLCIHPRVSSELSEEGRELKQTKKKVRDVSKTIDPREVLYVLI